MKQSLILLSAICIGLLLPELAQMSWAISYLLGVMIFFSFLKSKISYKIFTEIKIYYIFLANIVIGWSAYFITLPFFGEEIAFIAFLTGMIPTALAAPAVISVLKGNTEFVIACVLVTNFGIAFLLPLFSSFISPVSVNSAEMIINISLLLSIPFIIAQVLKKYAKSLTKKISSFSSIVFYLWGSIIILAMSKASLFLRENWTEYSHSIFIIAGITAIICVVNFTFGHFIGGEKYSKEGSQSLGQKNPMLMVWIALHFFTPLSALGPVFYILFHNLVNAWKLMKVKK